MLTSAVQAAPVLVNAGFENGDFSGWTLVEANGLNVVDASEQHSGDYAAFFGEVGAAARLSQQLATEVSRSHDVMFWLSNIGGSTGNSSVNRFQMALGANTVFNFDDKAADGYVPHTVRFIADSALTDLAFLFQRDDTFWRFDDLSRTYPFPGRRT